MCLFSIILSKLSNDSLHEVEAACKDKVDANISTEDMNLILAQRVMILQPL